MKKTLSLLHKSCFIFAFVVVLAGCKQGSGTWQEKYSDCKVLAGVMAKESSPFFKAPDCERIPQLCGNAPQSAECLEELKRYFRK